MMPKIDIKGLDQAEVALALYENADQKSAVALEVRASLLRCEVLDVPGLEKQMTIDDVRRALKKTGTGALACLGCVRLHINFYSDDKTINTDDYDNMHFTGVNGVESSIVVIARLKLKKEKEHAEVAEFGILTKRPAPVLHIRTKSTQKKAPETKAAEMEDPRSVLSKQQKF